MSDARMRTTLSAVDRLVLDALRRHGPLERAALAAITALPRSTLTDALARMRAHGLIEEALVQVKPGRPGRRGRPASVARLASTAGVVGVVSLTHGTLRSAVVDFTGRVVGERSATAWVSVLPDGPLGPGLALLDGALADAGLTRRNLACAVLGVPLPVIHRVDRAPVVDAAFPLRGWAVPPWAEQDLGAALAAELGVPAWWENDANLAVLGEQGFGAARGCSNLVYVKVAHGIGAGLAINGQLCRGARGLAGEMVHVHVVDDGPVCLCGSRGCLCTYVANPREIDGAALPLGRPVVSSVLLQAAQGDPGSVRVLADLGRLIGRSLADLCVYLNLEAVVLDGDLAPAPAPMLTAVRSMIDRYAYPTVAADVRVLLGTLGEHAEILGGLALARERLAAIPEARAGGQPAPRHVIDVSRRSLDVVL